MKKLLLIALLVVGNLFSQNLPPQSEIKMMTEKQKQLLYEKYEINPYLNMIFPIPPFTGYYRVGHLKKGIVKYFVLFLGGMLITGLGSFDGREFNFEETYTERIDATGSIVFPILIFDVYLQTKKYNKKLYKSIHGKEPSPISLNLQPTYKGAYLSMTYSFK